MKQLIAVLAAVWANKVTEAADCPYLYANLYGEKCYKFSEAQAAWRDARAFCQKDGGDLVSIHSLEENEAIQHALGDCCAYWTGLRCDPASHKPFWSDGTDVDFTHFRDPGSCTPTNAYFYSQPDGFWVEAALTDDSVYIICEIGGVAPTTTPQPRPSGGSECGLGYALLGDDATTCVLVGADLTTWREAEAECQLDGAHLASIHSKQSNDFIRRLALSNRLTNAVFIGFKLQNQTAVWADNSTVDYANFDPAILTTLTIRFRQMSTVGYLYRTDTGMPNAIFGECGAMKTGNLGGEWTSVFCDDSNKLPFVCTKPQPCPASNTFTVSGDFTSPEYPSSRSAGLSCEYFIGASPGSLVLLKFDEFQLVDGDQVILYEGEGTEEPLAVVTSAAATDRFMTKKLGVMRIVHQTGRGSGIRKWHANFVSF